MNRLMTLIIAALLTLSYSTVLSQNRTIAGVVLDAENGEPLVGASISVAGYANIGIATDSDGRFTWTKVPSSAKKIPSSGSEIWIPRLLTLFLCATQSYI